MKVVCNQNNYSGGPVGMTTIDFNNEVLADHGLY